MLVRGNLEVRTHATLLTLRPGVDALRRLETATDGTDPAAHRALYIVQGKESLTVITDEAMLARIEAAVDPDQILKRRIHVVELNLRLPDESEHVPGIVAFLATSLAVRGINILEAVAVHRDNLFLIDEDDLFEAFGILNGIIRT